MPTKYKEKPAVVEVWTWEEFLAYGKEHAESENEGVPWHFKFEGFPVTHENDQCYTLTTDTHTVAMTPEHLLVIDAYGFIQQFDKDLFDRFYEKV